MLINCLKCYRIHKCGDNKYYCPFLGVNPCIRGEHYIFCPPKPKNKPVRPPEQQLKIPEYVPVQRRRGSHGVGANVDWAKYHNEIFSRLNNDEPLAVIAKSLGLPQGTLNYYVNCYR